MLKLKCPDCGYKNEPERVYCHSCGVKLDRSVLPENQPENLKQQKPAKPPKMRKVNPFNFGAFLANIIKTVFFAGLVGTLIQIARPPEHIPQVSEEALMEYPMILEQLETVANSKKSDRLVYSEEQVNAYLKNTVKGKKNPSGFAEENFRFDRVYAEIQKDEVQLNFIQEAFGYKLYAGTLFHPEIQEGKLIPNIQGGHVGRLKIPAALMVHVNRLFENVWGALSKEKAALEKANSIVLEDQKIGIFFKPSED